MADELNTPTHRWHQPRNNIKLPNTDFSRDTIFDSGIQKIDAWINSQPWGNPIPALFAASEPGVWYDPSDITTLFQDSAGTTAVTAAGQPVGLMLDKSRGLGPQLVANGDFAVDTSGWTATGSAQISVVSGKMQVLNSAAANGNAYQVITTVVGRTYMLTAQINDVTGGIQPRIMAGTGIAAGDLGSVQYSGSGAFSARTLFTATGTSTWINAILNNTTVGVSASFDNISVQEVSGAHARQATAGSRPLYQIDGTGRPYIQFDGVDDSLDAATMSLVGAPYVAAVVGQRKERDTTIGTVLSHGLASSTAGFWQIFAPRSGTNYGWRGFDAANAAQDANGGAFPQPDLAVVSGLFDPAAASGVQITGRRNGSVIIQGGTGLAPFISTSLLVGKRGPAGDLPYLGRVYGVFVRGAATSTDQLVAVENWLNTKTGAY